jgi:hypothetical protein
MISHFSIVDACAISVLLNIVAVTIIITASRKR